MRRATDFPCVFLGRPADHFHHPSGRDAEGAYLDPDLVIPVVAVYHSTEHTGWNVAGIGDGSMAKPDVLRLRRNAHPLLRLADHHGDGYVQLPTFYLRELALILHRIANDVEATG